MGLLINIIARLKYLIIDFRYRRHVKKMLHEGLTIGRNVTIAPTSWIDSEYCFLISIGDNSSISKGVKLIAHDAATFKFTNGYTKIGKIDIKNNCFIGEDAIILPGVTIGPDVVVGAGSVVNKDVPPNSCVVGVPARFYCKFDEFIKQSNDKIKRTKTFNYVEISEHLSLELKKELIDAIEKDEAYVQGFPGVFPWNWNMDNSIK